MYLEEKQKKKAQKMENAQKNKDLGTVQEDSSDEESEKEEPV